LVYSVSYIESEIAEDVVGLYLRSIRRNENMSYEILDSIADAYIPILLGLFLATLDMALFIFLYLFLTSGVNGKIGKINLGRVACAPGRD
jgi:hypothetical protein